MMISEFIERTGFEPTASEYAKIEKAYYDFNGNKDEFCKAFVKNGGEKKIYKARAEEIAQLKSQLVEMEKQHKTEMEAREKQINDLTAELDRELEWKPSTGTGTNMSQSDYVISCCLGKKIIILDGLKEVLRQQKAIGNNLNQLAVLANMGKVQFANLDTAAQEFARINTALRELQEGGVAKSQSSIS